MKVLASLAFAVISLTSASAAHAADKKIELYPKVYDANYECVSATGKTEMRLTSDGKGKLRSESKGPSFKVVSISDYPGKICYSIMDAQKMITKMPLKQGYEGNMDAETAKKKTPKTLVSKILMAAVVMAGATKKMARNQKSGSTTAPKSWLKAQLKQAAQLPACN
jgi:hypothetical protein